MGNRALTRIEAAPPAFLSEHLAAIHKTLGVRRTLAT